MDTIFLHGNDLSKEIESILKQPTAKAAVAFWGRGAVKFLPNSGVEKPQLILNLASGGTNPYEVEELLKVADVKQLDDLHAKVYIGKTHAVVTSANASANGMGLEGSEQARWLEAGVLIKDIRSVEQWFDDLWNDQVLDITQENLDKAKKLWEKRQQSKLSQDFSDFDVEQAEVPIPLWYQECDYTVDKDSLKEQHLELTGQLEKAIDSGVDICTDKDWHFFSEKPRWGLHFRLKKTDNKVGKSPDFEWAYFDRYILKAVCKFEEDDQLYDCVIPRSDPPPPPFDVTDENLLSAFKAVINSGHYDDLLKDVDEEPGKPWYAPRENQFRDFWRDVKAEYNKA